MRFAVQKKILLGFIVSVVAIALTGWLSCRATRGLTDALDMVAYTQKAITHRIRSGSSDPRGDEQRGYLLAGSEKSLADSKAAKAELETNLSPTARTHF